MEMPATCMYGFRMRPLLAWVPLLFGLLALYVPTYVDLAEVFWNTRDGSYGAVMFLLAGWLLWRQRDVLRETDRPANRTAGAVLLGIGLIAYALGRSQLFYQLEVASQLPVLFGLTLLFLDAAALRALALPLSLLLFVVPLPGSLADPLLLPLKELVSRVVDDTLHWMGYPIARNGVVLLIGPYSLLVADACSGLNSMVALSGIGLVYVHLCGHARRSLNAALLLSALPIAFLANVLRVMALVLVTYHGGDAAGAAFHDAASYLEIAGAFGAFFLLDRMLTRVLRSGAWRPAALPPRDTRAAVAPSMSIAAAAAAACAMLLAGSVAWWLVPDASEAKLPRLAEIVPSSFEDWHQIETPDALVDPNAGTSRDAGPYDDVLMRAYGNSRGEIVLLALAYGRSQHQELKIHRPELCYVAQGFRVLSRREVTFPGSGAAPVAGERMLVQSPARVEAVSYWIRIGDTYSRSAWATRYYIFLQGLRRRQLDGVLVRVSQIVDAPVSVSERRFRLQEQFAADLVRALPADARRLLVVGTGV